MTNTSEPAEVTLNMQYIRDMSLEVPHAPEIFSKLNSQPKLNVDLNIDVNKLNENNFEVTLNLRIDADINEETCLIHRNPQASVPVRPADYIFQPG